jgi:hypothetical protein
MLTVCGISDDTEIPPTYSAGQAHLADVNRDGYLKSIINCCICPSPPAPPERSQKLENPKSLDSANRRLIMSPTLTF